MDHVLIAYSLAGIAFVFAGIAGVLLHRKEQELDTADRALGSSFCGEEAAKRELARLHTLISDMTKQINARTLELRWTKDELDKALREADIRRRRIGAALECLTPHSAHVGKKMASYLKGERDKEVFGPDTPMNTPPQWQDAEPIGVMPLTLKSREEMEKEYPTEDGQGVRPAPDYVEEAMHHELLRGRQDGSTEAVLEELKAAGIIEPHFTTLEREKLDAKAQREGLKNPVDATGQATPAPSPLGSNLDTKA